MRRAVAAIVSVLALVNPCLADIIPSEPPAKPKDPAAAVVVKAKLDKLGVAPSESANLVARLSAEDLKFLADHDNANAAVGQEDMVVMFWYEWIFAAVSIGLGYWAWTEWGEDAFFKD